MAGIREFTPWDRPPGRMQNDDQAIAGLKSSSGFLLSINCLDGKINAPHVPRIQIHGPH